MMDSFKKLIPNEKADKFGVLSTLALLLMVAVNDFITLYHKSFENPLYSIVYSLIGCFILFNVLGNMYQAMRIDTTIDSIQVQIKQLPDWKYCSVCEQYAPPRAFHCFTCKKCVLKRHNHCLFLGKCAGHKNLRFYLLFILYVWLGTVLSNFVNRDYFMNGLNDLSFKTIMVTCIPWLGWILGMLDLKDFYFVFTNTITFILFFLMFIYFSINFKMALDGQTWNENAKNIRLYNLNWKTNLLEIFGSNWKIALVCPFASLQLPSDGATFRRKSTSLDLDQNFKSL